MSLTGGNVTAATNTQVLLHLTPEDMFSIKNTPLLARNSFSAFITSVSQLAQDLSGNFMYTIFTSSALVVRDFTPLYLPVKLINLALNIDDSTLVFTYADLLDLAFINVNAIMFQMSNISTDVSYQLTPSSSSLQPTRYDYKVTVVISNSDMNLVKALYPLISNIAHSWVSYSSSFATDSFGNSVQIFPSINAAAITQFSRDVISPAVTLYTINMNTKIIALDFTEAINPSTAILSAFTVQSTSSARFGASSSLSTSLVSTGNNAMSNTLIITMSREDINSIKFALIARSLTTAYISWLPAFIADFAGNAVVPKYDSSVQGISSVLNSIYMSTLL